MNLLLLFEVFGYWIFALIPIGLFFLILSKHKQDQESKRVKFFMAAVGI